MGCLDSVRLQVVVLLHADLFLGLPAMSSLLIRQFVMQSKSRAGKENQSRVLIGQQAKRLLRAEEVSLKL